jgi:Flp pilus assembly protein TadD
VRSVGATIAAAALALALAVAGCATAPATVAPGATNPSAMTQDDSKAPPADPARSPDTHAEAHATATDRQRFQVHIDFGRAFESQGNLDAAIQEYQDALTVIENKRRGPFRPADEALAHRRIGSVMDRTGRFAQAETHYKKALKLSPKDAKIWNDAGYSYYLQGRWPEAEGALRTAAQLAPEDERIRTNLGLTLAASGRPELALPLLSQTNGDAIGRANLGFMLAATGQTELARRQYETALALRPDLEVARRALARIDRQAPGAQTPGMPPPMMANHLPSTPSPVDPGVRQVALPSTGNFPPLPQRVVPAPVVTASRVISQLAPTPPAMPVPAPVLASVPAMPAPIPVPAPVAIPAPLPARMAATPAPMPVPVPVRVPMPAPAHISPTPAPAPSHVSPTPAQAPTRVRNIPMPAPRREQTIPPPAPTRVRNIPAPVPAHAQDIPIPAPRREQAIPPPVPAHVRATPAPVPARVPAPIPPPRPFNQSGSPG